MSQADEIAMIRDSAAAVAPRDGSLARIRALRFKRPGYDPAVWRRMGELGWIGLRVPEAQGGSGLGLLAQGALLEELGAGLAPEPLVHGALSATVLAASGDQALLQSLLAGEVFVPLAWQEAPDGLDVPGTASGERCFVPLPPVDGPVLVSVRQGSALALFEARGQAVSARQTQDGGFAGAWQPDMSNARQVAPDIGPALAQALEDAALATGFYLLGLADRAFAMTLAYLRTRHQFGRPLGSFQALQHRCADLKIALTLTRASLEACALSLDAGATGPGRQASVARAKAKAATTALLVTREAVQLHGAIGYTDEFDVGLYLRKAMTLANQFGSARAHCARFSAVSLAGS